MLIPILGFILIVTILLRAFDAAGVTLLFLMFQICYSYMRARNLRQKEEAEHNEAVRIANQETRKRMAQKAANVSLRDLMKRAVR